MTGTKTRPWRDVGLLLFTIVGTAVVKLGGIETLLPPGASPNLVAVVMVAGVLVAAAVLLLVLNEGALIESYGSWVMVVTPILQAGFFSAVFLLMPLPWVLLRFLTAFLMSGGHLTARNVLIHYKVRSRLFGGSASDGSGSSFVRNSLIAGLVLGILGSLVVVGFLNRVGRGFNPLAANAVLESSSGASLPVAQSSDGLLMLLWTSIGLIVLAVIGVRNVMDRRAGRGHAARVSSKASVPPSARVADVEVPAASPEKAPRSDDGLGSSDDGLGRTDTLRRVREVFSQGDISAIRFETAWANTSMFAENLSDEAVESLMSGTVNDLLQRVPDDARLEVQIGRIYLGGAAMTPHIKKSIVVRKAKVRR